MTTWWKKRIAAEIMPPAANVIEIIPNGFTIYNNHALRCAITMPRIAADNEDKLFSNRNT
ncbi:hypothetical protein O9992_04685 [Vibrio lentus]|nr:hypothetical protein [Vibrio lentus]